VTGGADGAGGGWNFADVWETVADCVPDAPALLCGDRVVTWSEFDHRADGIAALLLERGAQQQDKIAQYLFNCPEYLESIFAAFKAGLVPVNTNYRYTNDELVYLWNNADVTTVVFHGHFDASCDEVRSQTPRITTWLRVDDGSGPCPPWATPYEPVVLRAQKRVVAPWGRSGDDLHLQYTGGTTGYPKGVMWRQDDQLLLIDNVGQVRLPVHADLDVVRSRTTKPGPRNLAAAPLMHGTALLNAFTTMLVGGSVATLEGRVFDEVALLDAIDRHRIGSMAIVGDVFARPMLAALEAEPDRWDVSSLRVITSSGVMLSQDSKQRLLKANPRLIIVDGLGSTEAFGMAIDISSAADAPRTTAQFVPRPGTRVLTDDGRDVVPGSGERGRIAQSGRMPIGYYKDREKTAATFVTYDGVRYTIPGDWAEIAADGAVVLLGRGSQCINTGGEKVYPEEVEEALKSHASVADAAVVGLPDDRFGQRVVAIVVPADRTNFDEVAVAAHARTRIAGYKLPKQYVVVATLDRAANGKLDYRRLAADAAAVALLSTEKPAHRPKELHSS
jgi:3-oxocholest-4-en-26-oate---CoA ligase